MWKVSECGDDSIFAFGSGRCLVSYIHGAWLCHVSYIVGEGPIYFTCHP